MTPSDIFQGAYTHLDLPAELPPYPQVLEMSPDDYGCDGFLCFSKDSDTESDVSVLTPPDLSQGYFEDSLYEQESKPVYPSYGTIAEMPLGENLYWRDSSIWSILQGEWPRLD